MLGATALSTECGALEQAGRSGTAVDAVARVAAIEALYRAVTLALETEAASLASGGRAGQSASPDPT